MVFFDSILRTILARFLSSPMTQPRIPEIADPEKRTLYSVRASAWGLGGPAGTRSFLSDGPAPAASQEPASEPQRDRRRRCETCLPQAAPLPAPRGLLACSSTPAPRGRRHSRRAGR